MAISQYKVDLYTSILKTELVQLTIIAIILGAIFITIIIGDLKQRKKFKQRKNNKSKNILYLKLFFVIEIFVLIFVSLFTQIVSYSRDIHSKAYVYYEGPANIRAKRETVYGGIPTIYTEYIISFKSGSNTVELSTRQDPKINGDIDKICIEYSKYSKFIFNITQ